MPPNNIWGRLPAIGITNPLQEDLLAGDFNALDFNEVHLFIQFKNNKSKPYLNLNHGFNLFFDFEV